MDITIGVTHNHWNYEVYQVYENFHMNVTAQTTLDVHDKVLNQRLHWQSPLLCYDSNKPVAIQADVLYFQMFINITDTNITFVS